MSQKRKRQQDNDVEDPDDQDDFEQQSEFGLSKASNNRAAMLNLLQLQYQFFQTDGLLKTEPGWLSYLLWIQYLRVPFLASCIQCSSFFNPSKLRSNLIPQSDPTEVSALLQNDEYGKSLLRNTAINSFNHGYHLHHTSAVFNSTFSVEINNSLQTTTNGKANPKENSSTPREGTRSGLNSLPLFKNAFDYSLSFLHHFLVCCLHHSTTQPKFIYLHASSF